MYQDLILKHARDPVGKGRYPPPATQVSGHNALCGDGVVLYARLGGSGDLDMVFESQGCALCRASASIMRAETQSKTVRELIPLVGQIQALLKSQTLLENPPWSEGLAALSRMRDFPTRLRCVLLPWETLGRLLAEVSS